MSTHNFEVLRDKVVSASIANNWANAVVEWRVVSVEEDPSSAGECQCGKTDLRYLYTIENRSNGQELSPIGSRCVTLFGVAELDETVKVLRQLFRLKAAYEANEIVELDGGLFTRATLADLWENGAFPPNEFNRFDGYNDYRFLVDLFNQHHELTVREGKKVWVLLNRTIRPFVLDDDRLR